MENWVNILKRREGLKDNDPLRWYSMLNGKRPNKNGGYVLYEIYA